MEFRRIWDGDQTVFEAFIETNQLHALDMVYSFETFGLKNLKQEKRSGDFYGFFDDGGRLKAAFIFTNKKLMSGYFEDKDVLKRVDFLKTIRQYAPLFMIGTQGVIDPIFDLLHRSLKSFVYDPCYLMAYPKDRKLPGKQGRLIQARTFDFKQAIDFLIEAEVAFGRNPKIINNLKQQIWDEAKAAELYFMIDEDRILAQGAIELETAAYAQIGGLYTAKIHRQRGHAEALMRSLIQLVLDREKTPILYVSKKNAPAVELYRKLGFETVGDMLSIHTEL